MAGPITSIKDARVAEARKLGSAAGRRAVGKCRVEGHEAIAWALDSRATIEHVFSLAHRADDPLAATLAGRGIPLLETSDGVLKKITDTTYAIPLVGVARLPPEPGEDTPMGELVLVLDGVQDHGNLGTLVRTASAFGISDIVSTSQDVDLYYKKTIMASRGRVLDARVWRHGSGREAIRALRGRGFRILATSPHADELQSAVELPPQPLAVVVGNETDGIADETLALSDQVVRIPMSGEVESLNVGVAAGISLYELKGKLERSLARALR